jgi:hypothetical protein
MNRRQFFNHGLVFGAGIGALIKGVSWAEKKKPPIDYPGKKVLDVRNEQICQHVRFEPIGKKELPEGTLVYWKDMKNYTVTDQHTGVIAGVSMGTPVRGQNLDCPYYGFIKTA